MLKIKENVNLSLLLDFIVNLTFKLLLFDALFPEKWLGIGID